VSKGITVEIRSRVRVESIWWVFVPSLLLLLFAFATAFIALAGWVAESLTGPLVIAAAFMFVGSCWLLGFGASRDGQSNEMARAADRFEAAADAARDLGVTLEDVRATPVTVVEPILVAQPNAESQSEVAAERDGRLDAQRGLREWQDRVVELTQGLERIMAEDDLKPEYRKVAERLCRDVERTFSPLGFTIVRPEPGAAFDDLMHEIVDTREGGTANEIVTCEAWGFVVGDRRFPARVVVSTGSAG
jgi:hypothetical protein